MKLAILLCILFAFVILLCLIADILDHKRRNSWLQASDDALRHASYGDASTLPADLKTRIHERGNSL